VCKGPPAGTTEPDNAPGAEPSRTRHVHDSDLTHDEKTCTKRATRGMEKAMKGTVEKGKDALDKAKDKIERQPLTKFVRLFRVLADSADLTA